MIAFKEDDMSKLQMKVDEMTNDNYKFKDLLDNKIQAHKELHKEISNLKIELLKSKDQMSDKENEMDRIDKSKQDMKV